MPYSKGDTARLRDWQDSCIFALLRPCNMDII